MSSAQTALKWSFFGELASKAVTPVVFVVLARLLTPEDFGVVAAATMVISFSQIFWEAGMGKAIIQYRGDRTVAANTAFWINNALGVVVAGLLALTAQHIADFIFQDSRVSLVLQVMALQVLLSASISIHIALLQKDLNFRHLFWVRLATVAIPGLASIPLALNGMGYWALVAGTLAGQIFQVGLLWKTSSWRPSFAFDRQVAVELIRFGGWVATTALLAWFYLWADSMIVGIYLGSHELGLYRSGNVFVIMIFGLLFSPLMPVFYSYLSKVGSTPDRAETVLRNIMRLVAFVSVPLACIISILSPQIESIVFGANWVGIASVLAIMSITQGLAWCVYPFVEYYRGIGRPDLETKVMIYTLPLYIAVYLISVQAGLAEFLWARLILVAISMAFHWWVFSANFSVSVRPLFLTIMKFSCGPILVAISWALITEHEVITHHTLIWALIACAVVIGMTIILGRKDEIPLLKHYLRERN
ncbi:MAG: lipopolysaccharide biosynthesis protein [Gammaproteobacteria bacterium]|nr:lipopolysaccharide biosynthesis protein [Gammaproteobacteria bacterium]